MSLRLGQTAPDFTIETQNGEISFHQWANGSWVYLFSHPADFTPVCTTEMGRTAILEHDFAKRNVKPIGLSADTLEDHIAWIKDVNETQNANLTFPIIADPERRISTLYDMFHPEESTTMAIRAIYIIDPKMKIRTILTYPPSVGRSFKEILRVIDALQANDKYGTSTPADWTPGDYFMVPPEVTTEEAHQKFSEVLEVKPYLRYAKL